MSSARRAGKEPTAANGYRYGRPETVEPHELDAVISRVIEKIDAEVRLYPDIYAWKIREAVLEAIAKDEQKV